jgi:DNA/RNA endonuclease G (NUC1)
MKRILTLLLVLITISSCAQSPTGIVEYEDRVFKVLYSEEFEQPLRLEYTVDCWDGEFSRKGLNFYKVKGFHTSDDEDYKNNVWDKGHLAPAAAFSCDAEELRMTFSYLNCALQHEGLNRGPWKDLEAYERKLAQEFGIVRVIIELEFKDSTPLPTGALVPTAFKKTIIVDIDTDPNRVELHKLKYLFPNIDLRKQDYNNYEIR